MDGPPPRPPRYSQSTQHTSNYRWSSSSRLSSCAGRKEAPVTSHQWRCRWSSQRKLRHQHQRTLNLLALGFGLYELGFPSVAKCIEIGLPEIILLVALCQDGRWMPAQIRHLRPQHPQGGAATTPDPSAGAADPAWTDMLPLPRRLHDSHACQKKVVKIFPCPTSGPLRLIVQCQTRKYNIKARADRGFTLEELKEFWAEDIRRSSKPQLTTCFIYY
ncbi:uncharacterized protein [Aegilops tauschii subsp. strangulata]|uniref:uncharacterized protein n=1 Tax=Aegilops tauschii subsp. strangulata TaxID=200361 RepID=UPI00098B951F|nr:uncharacterized protein LOC109782279 [Aegilops tauschii subsp. strangulata]XP_045088005.1 uncharacterized protein LOC109782279 [Aegilops tauschii subsp. strangulata]XP_045088006.1 uncharacterized protein LOC109782279 [Aegilops tauschii subsp. strangulata]